MRANVSTSLLALTLGLTTAGCEPDLGECDPTLALTTVYFRDAENRSNPRNGVPLYAGQALMQQSCGDGAFCHSQGASGSERYGAPAGLDLDVSLACTDGKCEDADIARLVESQHRIYDQRFALYETVVNGRMPPGRRGRSVVEQAGEYVYVDPDELLACGSLCSVQDGLTVVREVVPGVGTSEGRRILRNWLSCGAPVVEATEDPTTTPPGLPCSNTMGTAGECVVRIASDITAPDPDWASIYEGIIGPLCGQACHGPGELDLRSDSMLDLSDASTAYMALVGQPAQGSSCDGMGTRVVAGDSASSLLIEKLRPDPSCGDPMPPSTVLLPEDVIDAIAQWIDDGALEG